MIFYEQVNCHHVLLLSERQVTKCYLAIPAYITQCQGQIILPIKFVLIRVYCYIAVTMITLHEEKRYLELVLNYFVSL